MSNWWKNSARVVLLAATVLLCSWANAASTTSATINATDSQTSTVSRPGKPDITVPATIIARQGVNVRTDVAP